MYRTAIETKYTPGTGTKVRVASGAALQAALNGASPGDEIILDPSVAYVGNFEWKEKTGPAPIIIRPENLTPEGKRITSEPMPRIISPNAGPAVRTLGRASNYRAINCEVGIAAGWQTSHGLVTIGDSAITRLEDLPSNIIFDRCRVTGNDQASIQRGVTLNGFNCAVIDSRVEKIHGVGVETQAIALWNGSKIKIDNCYLEGAGINFLVGGADPKIPNLVPSDIQFTRNHCFKPLSWNPAHATYAGKHWSVKNLLELKNAAFVLIEGNIFENNWVDAQSGHAILFTVRNQDGAAPWSTISDVTFKNNEVINSPHGFSILGTDYTNPSQQLKRVKITNSLLRGIGGRFATLLDMTDGVEFEQVTSVNGGHILVLSGRKHTNLKMRQCIVSHNEYGIMGDNSSPGQVSIDAYMTTPVITENLFVDTPSVLQTRYPAGNLFPKLSDLQLSADFRVGNALYKNYGCDIDQMIAARSTGAPPPPVVDEKARIIASLEAAITYLRNH